MMAVHQRRGTLVGRGDLLRSITAAPPEDTRVIGEALGFELRAPAAIAPRGDSSRGGRDDPKKTENQVVVPGQGRAEVRFWRVVEHAPHVVPATTERTTSTYALEPGDTLTEDDFGPLLGAKLPHPRPLVPLATLRRTLENLLGGSRSTGSIDLDVVVERMGRGEPIEWLPRRIARSHPGRVVVVLDRDPRLIPFFDDQIDVLRLLHSEIVGAELEHVSWLGGPPVCADDAGSVNAVAPGLDVGDIVLVLGDLGCYGSSFERRVWSRLGEALMRRGVGAAALLPVPRSRWPRSVPTWTMREWEGSYRQEVVGARRHEGLGARRERLLELLSWTRRLEPGLLRAARMALPAAAADVGTEADVWNDPRLVRHPAGLIVPDAVRLAARACLAESLAKAADDAESITVMRCVVESVRAWHQPVAREVWLDEARGLASIGGTHGWINPEECAEIEAFTVKLHAHVKAHQQDTPLSGSVDLRGWICRSGRGQTRDVLEDERWGKLVLETWDAVAPEDEREMPPDLPARMLPPKPGAMVQRFVVGQVGGELHVAPEGVEASASRLSPIVTVPARARWLQVGRRAYALDDEGVRRIDLPAGEVLELATDCVEKVQLRLECKPTWARAMGRDRQGLWVQYGEHRLAWPGWAREVGEDGFGLWATFRVGEAEQRMRWIAPGTFVMGSPEGEEGRYHWEGPQHEVTLTEGYWLADTPCTQAMWVAVMGNNPSRYQSTHRPVEQVSWDDVQGFLAELDARVPGLEAGLPTEAQWEHACRAGTTAATYAGDLRIVGENDAPRLDDIAWYGGNSGVRFELANGTDSSGWPNKQYPHTRAGTREVALKRPNPWGLYDMLGNVLEWCADMPRRYDGQPATNPEGTVANALGPRRVRRGGGWISDARYCRAAYRLWLVPGLRRGILGFRLSRGQGLRPGKSGPEAPTSEESGRGTRPASPGVPRKSKRRV